MKLKKTLLFSSLFFVSCLAVTSLASCAKAVDSKITSNMVDKEKGTRFASSQQGDLTLSEMIKMALTDPTSTNSFKDFVTNEILYRFYYDICTETDTDKHNIDWNTYKKNWDDWTTSAGKSYDDKVTSYKNNKGSNWPYYFQNEVLDPLGIDGTLKNPVTGAAESERDSYVRLTMYPSIRNDFVTKVFERSYLALPKDIPSSSSYKTLFNSDVEKGDYNNIDTKLYGTKDDVAAAENKWQYIDFYPKANPNYNVITAAGASTETTYDKYLDWVWAYLQHVTFQEYTYTTLPVSTVMVLWKGSENKSDFASTYNIKDDSKNPLGTVSADAKASYEYPVFDNNKWKNFAPKIATDIKNEDNTNNFILKNSGLFNIPVSKGSDQSYTDDSATLIKVNLASDAFTSLDVTFSAATSYLYWNTIFKNTGVKMTSVPVSTGILNQNDLLKNFLYRARLSKDGDEFTYKVMPEDSTMASDAPTFDDSNKPTYSFLGPAFQCEPNKRIKNLDSHGKPQNSSSTTSYFVDPTTENNKKYPFMDQQVTVTGDIEAFGQEAAVTPGKNSRIVQGDETVDERAEYIPHAEVFNNNIDLYTDGYVATLNAYQPSASVPCMLIRERSGGDKGTGGVHFIAIDGYSHIASADTRTIREKTNDVLKVRCLANLWNDDRYSSSFNFVTTDLKTFFQNNMDEIILELAMEMKDPVTSSDFKLGNLLSNTIGQCNMRDDFKAIFGENATSSGQPIPYSKRIFKLPSKDVNAEQENLFKALYKIAYNADILKNYEAVVKNLKESYEKLMAFNSAEITNDKWNGASGVHGKDKFYPISDIYKNGIASQFPFAVKSRTLFNNKADAAPVSYLLFDVEIWLYQAYFAFSSNEFIGDPVNPTNEITVKKLTKNLDDAVDSLNIGSTTPGKTPLVSPKARPKTGNAYYSEHIFTDSGAINALINGYCATDTFTNSILLSYSWEHLMANGSGDAVNESAKFLDSSNMFANINVPTTVSGVPTREENTLNPWEGVFANNIYFPKLVANNSFLTSTNPTSVEDLVKKAGNTWKSQQLATNTWGFEKTEITDGDYAFLGTSADKISYWKTLDTIKYLLFDDQYKFNPKRFIEWQASKVVYGQPAYFLWVTKNSTDYTNSGLTGSVSDFEWKANYQKFNNTKFSGMDQSEDADYSNKGDVGTTPIKDTCGYSENPNYFKYANAKVSTDTPTNVDLMGYLGLVTSSTDNVTKHGAENLFESFKNGNANNPSSDGEGALARYVTIGPYINVKTDQYWDLSHSGGAAWSDITPIVDKDWFKNSLTGYLYINRSVSNTKAVAKAIDGAVKGFDGVYDMINSYKDPYDETLANVDFKHITQALITAIYGTSFDTSGSMPSKDPYYLAAASTSGQQDKIKTSFKFKTLVSGDDVPDYFKQNDYPSLLINERNGAAATNKNVFYNEVDGTNNAAEVLYLQVNPADFMVPAVTGTEMHKPVSEDDFATVYYNLIAKYGESIIYNLVYTASQDPINSNEASKKVRGTEKVTVYDRRFNDKLGTLWVENYKEKN